jgi:hypothetical protein
MVVGAMSDFLFTGSDGVRFGLAVVNLATAPFAFWLIWRARRPYLERRGA